MPVRLLPTLVMAVAPLQKEPAQPSADMFKDVEKTEWLYRSELRLHWTKCLLPLRDVAPSFGGKPFCTRYEYAVLIDRALTDLRDWARYYPKSRPETDKSPITISSYVVRWQARPVKDPATFLAIVRDLRRELKLMGHDSTADETLIRRECKGELPDDQPVTLKRTFKKGDVGRYKAESKIILGGGEAKMAGTSSLTVKEIKLNGDVVIEELDEGGTLTFNGTDREIPKGRPSLVTRTKYGKLLDFKVEETALSQQSPEVTRLMAAIGNPFLPEKPVKPGDTWENEVDNPLLKDKKVDVKTTFVGTEKVDGKAYWKLRQSSEALTDATGGKMTYEGAFWLDPANGQEERAEVNIKNLPSNFGSLTLQIKAERVKSSEKSDK